MNSERFTLLPIGYVALVLAVSNLIGYVAVTHLERCGYGRRMKNIDVISSFICFGISFVFVTVPTIAAPGAHPINQMSAALIFLWSMLYMISLYSSVYDTLSTLKETEWMQWVALSFLYLLPYSMGLTRISRKKTYPLVHGLLVSMAGLLMLFLSSCRTWQHFRNHVVDAEPAFSPLIDSWWGNGVFWFGIFLLNAHAMVTPPDQIAPHQGTDSRMTTIVSCLVFSFFCGPGLLFLSHPHVQRFLYGEFYSSLLGIQQPVNSAAFSVPLVDPTLLRFVRQDQMPKTDVGIFTPPVVDKSSHVPNIETVESTDSPFLEVFPHCFNQPEFSTSDFTQFDFETTEVLETVGITNSPKESQVIDQPIITSQKTFVSKEETELEQPVSIRIEKPTNSFKRFLSQFKLKITTDILSGQWE